MNKRSLQFLKSLVNTPSPSGHESKGLRIWMDYVDQYADETYSDAYGNCVAVLNKGGGPRLMLAGHADEIGMTVNFIDDNGYVYVRRLGGTNPAITKAQRVTIHSRKGPVKGVVGSVAPHLMRTDTGVNKVPKIHEIFVDIGADSCKAAEKLIRVGDPITLNDQFELLRGDLAVARAFDNRVGTWAVAETLRLLKTGKAKLNAEVCAVANTMEEVGLFGARQIAYSLHPDVALVMDVTHATDYPTVDKRQHGDIIVGQGPTVTHGNCNHPEVIKRVEQVAKRLKINLQHEAISATSGTDTDAVFWTRGGIPSGLISLPNRYMHSPVEVVSLKDLEQIPQVMAGFAKSLKKGETFKVKI
ncbi:MAG: M42 family metallopeptidase [Verrucomicrobiota bacterium]|jgi:putative aminopeptidase FrvX|nr:ABC transporter ATP-binding protein [Verrucomicrobiales bacterium]MEC9080721.1 M42 family metallopeptidase [Verrucomicrobiota bacterium]MED6314275.1 M42 family metallopeptidase [Verrucomicrobiota bacterium]MEE2942346.1 M42 family metallopeptidase [Verrucomicrobiota bacterium]|tara:strand:- start:37 stop:1110 length:1074 start_codon:yes stop_codon:yes gene_type:complete